MTAGVDAAAPQGGDAAAPATPTTIGWSTSPDTDQLMPALVAALGELADIPRSRTANAGTYQYKYADLGDALTQIRGVFAGHGLAVFHDSRFVDGEIATAATIIHTSGQWLTGSAVRLPTGNTAQQVGSAMTYSRRYSLMSLCGLATDDDDGAAAGTRDEQTMSATQVAQFEDAAANALLTGDEIRQVVLEATQGRTSDPAKVFRSEMQALRDALAGLTAHTGGGVVASDTGSGDASSPAAEASPDQLDLADTPDE